MTDPEWADATYIEPLDLETVTEVIEAERPDALLPTLGGQTALNLAVELHEAGVLEEYGVELLGASVDAIRRAEDRLAFRDAVVAAGLEVPLSEIVTSGCQTPGRVPAVVRPAFTLGGHGRRHRAHAGGARGARRPRPRCEPGRAGARRGVARGLAGVRARGDVRRTRQLRRRLLDREPRPDGRAHRRLVDGRAAADAAGRRVPAAARGGVRLRARRRRRDRRRERAVCVRAARRASSA